MKTLLSLFLLLALGASAATGIKISEYPNTPVLTNSELFIVAVTNVTPATNRNISYGQLRSLLSSNNFVGSFTGDGRNASNVVVTASNVVSGGTLSVTSAVVSGYSPRLAIHTQPPEIIPETISNGMYNCWQVLDMLPSGKFIMIYREGTTHGADIGIMRMRTSTDQGFTWSAPRTIKSDALYDIEGTAGGVSPSGRIILEYSRWDVPTQLPIDLHVMYSDDEGNTWSTPALIPTGTNGVFQSYGALVAIADNTILLPWYGRITTTSGLASSYVITSTNNGSTWSSPITAASSTNYYYNETTFCYLGGRVILGMIRNDSLPNYTQVISVDNGLTWTNQGVTTFDIISPGGPAWLKAYTAPNGRMEVACYYTYRLGKEVRAIYAYATDVINNGSSAWNTNTKVTVGTLDTTGGYPSVVHPYNNPYGLGTYYADESGPQAFLKFFIAPVSTSIPMDTYFVSSVGIGTNNPSSKLEVVGDIRATGIVYGNGAGLNVPWTSLSNNSTPTLVVTNSKAGLGKLDPSSLLDVLCASGTAVNISSSVGNNTSADIALYNTAVNGYCGLDMYNSSSKEAFVGIGGPSASPMYSNNLVVIAYNAGSDVVLGAGGAEAARISVAGKVGVGNTNPYALFDIYNASGSGVPFRVNDNSGLGVYVSQGNTLNFDYGWNGDDGSYINFHGYSDGATRFRTLYIANGKQVPIASFDGPTQNVGIGTGISTPDQRLVVDGNIAASGAVIATNAFVMPPVNAGPAWCTNGLAAMWNSNNNGQATIYLRTSAVGATTFADKLVAP